MAGTDMTRIISGFNGEYRFLSNFWMARIMVGGMWFSSSEHAYQAAKSLDPKDWALIQRCASPGGAKRAGRHITLRPDWKSIKLEAMEEILWAKFTQHPDLMRDLIMTRDMDLIETNTWGDTYWGVCKGKGENHLGKLLMKIRG